ncbi:hypothetical protein TNCV_1376641 [Trichonephila clavipes]|nr:hypothetical protein TNCV_1376641 [Trichonephila clavipes]
MLWTHPCCLKGSFFRREDLRGRGRPRDFCDLPIRRDEGRVVNTPLVFKKGSFSEERKKAKETEKERERVGDGERREERESGRESERSPPCFEKRVESGDWSGKTMNAGGVENGI